jgi:hypothetical protein
LDKYPTKDRQNAILNVNNVQTFEGAAMLEILVLSMLLEVNSKATVFIISHISMQDFVSMLKSEKIVHNRLGQFHCQQQ